MPRYHSIAKEANNLIFPLVQEYKTSHSQEETDTFTEQLLRIYNLGIRTSPRSCQSTVRRTAVEIAASSLPVMIGMKTVQIPNSNRSYNALTITPKSIIGSPTRTMDDSSDDE